MQLASAGASLSDSIVQQGRAFAAGITQQEAANGGVVAMPAIPPQLISGLSGIISGLDSSMGQVNNGLTPLLTSTGCSHAAVGAVQSCSSCWKGVLCYGLRRSPC